MTTQEKPYKVEVVADRTNEFYGNALTFETIETAIEYARDLMSRWMLVTNWRVVHIPTSEVVTILHDN
jgi:hypothetical protein